MSYSVIHRRGGACPYVVVRESDGWSFELPGANYMGVLSGMTADEISSKAGMSLDRFRRLESLGKAPASPTPRPSDFEAAAGYVFKSGPWEGQTVMEVSATDGGLKALDKMAGWNDLHPVLKRVLRVFLGNPSIKAEVEKLLETEDAE